MDADKTRVADLNAIVLTSLLFALPSIHSGFDGLRTLIPLVPFYYSLKKGDKQARRIISIALAIGGVTSAVLGNFSSILYVLFLLPAGFSLVQSSRLRLPVAWAGGITSLLIMLAWLIGGLLYWIGSQSNPYVEALNAMDKAFESMAASYQGQDLAPDIAHDVDRAISQARVKVPALFPSILIISALLVSWLNMVIGNRLLRKGGFQAPWPRYRYWRLPDNLIWLLIVAAGGVIIFSGSLATFFLNMLLVLISIYVMQGLAVMQAMFERWTVPKMARVFIYAIICFQTFSVLLLAVLGVMDIWKDLGKIKPEIPEQ